MSKKRASVLLINEEPLQVIPTLAEKLGINEAILLQQIQYWIKNAEKNGTKDKDYRKFINGRWWTYNTFQDWQKQMPWLSVSGIRKLVKKLKDRKLIAVVKHKAKSQDHTLWYTINYDAVDALVAPECQFDVTESNTSNRPGVTHDDVTQSDTSYIESENPENHTKNSVGDADTPQQEEKPAKVMTTLTVDRTREVGFDAARHQIANWGKGWSEFIYVPEGQTPPSAERQYAVLNEIVAAAAGKRGKARFFRAVEDAVKLVNESNVRELRPKQPKRDSIAVIGATDEDYSEESYGW